MAQDLTYSLFDLPGYYYFIGQQDGIQGSRMSGVAERERGGSLVHKPQPTPWKAKDGVISRKLVCRFCGQPIQRRGLLRRWAHVA